MFVLGRGIDVKTGAGRAGNRTGGNGTRAGRKVGRANSGDRKGRIDPNFPDYWMDRYEVTNKKYKEFVDAGGYRKPEFWKVPFVENASHSFLGRGDDAIPG